jgi:hypothetical protein
MQATRTKTKLEHRALLETTTKTKTMKILILCHVLLQEIACNVVSALGVTFHNTEDTLDLI